MRSPFYFSFLVLALAAACSSNNDTGNDAGTCTPTTCAAQNKNCGDIVDGCGKSLHCGDCTGTDTCGGGNVANVCGAGTCTSQTTCAAQGKSCGLISDGCNAVLDCGTCGSGGACVANVCTATATDASTPDAPASTCDSTCMQAPNAVCCTTCGCKTTDCKPACASPLKWDCEMQCCFDYTALKCAAGG